MKPRCQLCEPWRDATPSGSPPPFPTLMYGLFDAKVPYWLQAHWLSPRNAILASLLCPVSLVQHLQLIAVRCASVGRCLHTSKLRWMLFAVQNAETAIITACCWLPIRCRLNGRLGTFFIFSEPVCSTTRANSASVLLRIHMSLFLPVRCSESSNTPCPNKPRKKKFSAPSPPVVPSAHSHHCLLLSLLSHPSPSPTTSQTNNTPATCLPPSFPTNPS